jgi:hypothetical protein
MNPLVILIGVAFVWDLFTEKQETSFVENKETVKIDKESEVGKAIKPKRQYKRRSKNGQNADDRSSGSAVLRQTVQEISVVPEDPAPIEHQPETEEQTEVQ